MKHTDIHYGGRNDQLAFTTLGFGGLEVGWYRKYVQHEDAIALVQEAYNSGVRVFDTSPLYGATRSEWVIGAALKDVDRSSYVLSSKAGYDVTGYAPDFAIAPNVVPRNYSYDFIMNSVEGSLKRLNTDYLDIVHIHDTEDGEDFKLVMDGAYRALSDLRDQGVIRGIGFGNKYNSQMLNAATAGDFDAFLCACRYSLLDHEDFLNDLQEIVEKKHIAIMAGGVFSSGLASNPYAENPMWDYLPATPEQIKRAQDVDKICKKYNVTLRQAAAQFAIFNPVVKTVVLGCGSSEHFQDNVRTFSNLDIPVDLWQELKHLGYISEKAPVPGDPA